jgi:hypothetical protein
MPTRLVAWQGPDPRRVEAVRARLHDDSLTAHGTSTTADHVLTYRLAVGPGWVTRSLDVDVRGDGWGRAVALARSPDGEWTATWSGDVPPGQRLPDAGELAGALDCDLGLCPLTNTMPIRRLGLVEAAHAGEQVAADLVMAWVSVPDLAIHADPQRYAVGEPVDGPDGGPEGGGALVRFANEGFATSIEVDADGLAVTYPGLAYRLPLPA